MEKIVPEVVFQVAMVVKSVDTTIKQLTEYFQIDESSIVIKTTKDMAQPVSYTHLSQEGLQHPLKRLLPESRSCPICLLSSDIQ